MKSFPDKGEKASAMKAEKSATEIGERLVKALKEPQDSDSQESFAKALELTRAYAGSGAVTHYSAVTRLFYDLFDMFETGRDPRDK